MKAKQLVYKYRYIIFLIFSYILSSTFVYTGDDWAWGSIIGTMRLQDRFYDYGGRYLGYIIVLILTRSVLIRNIVMACSFTLLTYLTEKMSGNRLSVLIVPLLLFSLPKDVWRQSVAWTSGFSNYTTSIVLSLFSICRLREIFISGLNGCKNTTLFKRSVHAALFLLLGISNTLIVEHMTLYNLFIGVAFLLIYWLKYRKNNLLLLANLAGCVIGTLTMFSNSTYHNIRSGKDEYRSVATSLEGIIKTAKRQWVNSISTGGVQYNYLINMTLSILLIIAFSKSFKMIRNHYVKGIGSACITACLSFSVWSFFSQQMIAEKTNFLTKAEGFLSIVYLFSVFISVVIIGFYHGFILDSALFAGSIFVVLVPLTIVNPIGGRCYFAADCFFILLVCMIGDYAFGDWQEKNRAVRQCICMLLLTATIVVYVQFLYIYSTISVASHKQLDLLKKCEITGESDITISPLPYESYVWCSRLDGIWKYRYRLFHNLSWKVDFHYDE